MLGIRLNRVGNSVRAPALIVANHVSWLDIYAVNAVAPATFVCKDEVRRWPLIGWLVAKTGSIFIERGKRTAAQRAADRIRARLLAGDVVVLFPEGTTTDGSKVLPFHGAPLQAAIDAGCDLRPVALSYTDALGSSSAAPAYWGEITLWQSLWAVALASGLQANVEHLAPLAPTSGNRRGLAALAHAHICRRLERLRQPHSSSQWTGHASGATLDGYSEPIEELGDEFSPAQGPL